MLSSVLDQPALAQFYQAGFPPSGRLQGQTGSIYPPPPLKQQLQEDHIRYVILHPLDIPPQDGWAQTYLRRELGTPFYRNDAEGLIAWRVEGRPPSGLYRLTTGSGWLAGSSVLNGKALRVVEQDGQLIIDAPRAGRRSLRFEADAYFRPLTMEIRLNGVSVKQIRFAPNVFQTVSLPALHLKRGVNILTIHAVEGCARASDFTAGLGDPRCYAFGIEQVRLGPA
jgi:hypothetical protein